MKKTQFVLFLLLFVNLSHASVSTTVYISFDNFPSTLKNQIPGSSLDWIYTSATTNPQPGIFMTSYDSCGWRSQTTYPAPDNNVYDLFYRYNTTTNSNHMGFETYGFLEIDKKRAVKGKSLRYVVTGGKNSSTCPDGNNGPAPCNANGLEVKAKEHYLQYLGNNQNPVEGDRVIGHPYIYFANTSSSNSPVPFQHSQGKNRLSLYIFLPEGLTNGSGGNGVPPYITVNIGPYDGVGGHWYHQFTFQGGGWAHLIVDGHPQHNNAWSDASKYPYPSSSLRDLGGSYFNNMYRWYITAKPYEGLAAPPYSIWIDEIEFQLDNEVQNNETICSPSIMLHPETKIFELGFMDKYKNTGYSHSTYEVRYSFNQITNANWELATPVKIQEDARFNILARSDGKFQKWWPYYQQVWAPFRLQPADEKKLVSGKRIYFAIMDISQVGGDSLVPTDSLTGVSRKGGRDYENYPDKFDFAGDQAVLKKIKRIDYLVPKPYGIDLTPVNLLLLN